MAQIIRINLEWTDGSEDSLTAPKGKVLTKKEIRAWVKSLLTCVRKEED